jgi:hypothetical protein
MAFTCACRHVAAHTIFLEMKGIQLPTRIGFQSVLDSNCCDNSNTDRKK